MGYAEVFLEAAAFRSGDFYLCKGSASASDSNGKCLCASAYDSDECWERVKPVFHTRVKSRWENFCHDFNKKKVFKFCLLYRKKKGGGCFLVNSTISCFHKTALKINC